MKTTYPREPLSGEPHDPGLESYYLWCQLFGCTRVATAHVLTCHGMFDLCVKHNTPEVYWLLEKHGTRVRDSIYKTPWAEVMKVGGHARAPLMSPLHTTSAPPKWHLEWMYPETSLYRRWQR